jgi:hypothetical protein
LGLLIEEARTNIILQSADLATTWTVLTAAVQADQITAPDNTLSADKIVPDNAAALGGSGVTQTVTAVAGTYTLSCFAKIGEFNRVRLLVRDNAVAGNNASVTVSLVDGAITTAATAAGTFTGASATVRPWALGFYRITLTMTTTGAVSLRTRILVDDSVATVGDGVKGIYAWGAQLEVGAFATSYIPTTTTSLTRNADAVSMTGTNFSDWYNASAGTLAVSATGYNAATVAQGGVAPTAVSLYAIAATSPYASIAIVRRDAATLNSPTGYILSDTGTIGADIQKNTISWVGATVNAAIAWNGSTNAAFTANGLTVGTDTSYTLPTSDSLQIGRWGSESISGYWSGHIRKVSFYPQRLTNAELQAITT